MSPEQILAAVAEAYATCTTYRDSGVVTTRFINADGDGHTTTRPFETAFVRPDRFRFEYRDRDSEEEDWGRYIVWAHGSDVRTWWYVTPGVETEKSLGLALAGATGVSGGSAHTAPSLLMPDVVGGSRLTDMASVVSLGDAPLDGVTCYRLARGPVTYAPDPAAEEEFFRATGKRMGRADEGPVVVWVDRGTFLVRRIEEATHFETFRTEEVTDYRPEVGVAIRDDELRFDPPDGSARPTKPQRAHERLQQALRRIPVEAIAPLAAAREAAREGMWCLVGGQLSFVPADGGHAPADWRDPLDRTSFVRWVQARPERVHDTHEAAVAFVRAAQSG